MIEEGKKILEKVVELDVNDVLPNRFQPRIKFSEDSINELAESIKEHGVIQPIVVRPMGDKYEIIAGERRYKACLLTGKSTIPAIITDLNDKDSAEVALIENVQRKDLTPIEEAISYKKILDMGYLTQDELATKLGKNQSTVANKLRLLNLAEDVQEAVLEEKISERHARSLLKLKDQKQQLELLDKIIANRLTVRKTDEEIAKMLNNSEDNTDSFEEEPVIIIDEPKKENDILDTLKGNNIMNDTFDPFKMEEPIDNKPVESLDFNIPTNPIEDIVPFEEPKSDDINPGFMDINKIENNAQDINIEKPEVDINSLLMPTMEEKVEESKVEEIPTVEVPKEEIPTNKFFSFPFMDEKKEEVEIPIVTETPSVDAPTPVSNNNDVFNFDFNDLNSTSTSTPIVTNSVEVPTEEPKDYVESNFDLDSIIPTPLTKTELPQIEEPVINNNIEEMVTPSPILTQPIMNNNLYNSEDVPVPTIQPNVTAKPNNIMEALNIVRNCSKELEKLGYVIDMEEIDFESVYQIIFKIQK